VPQIAFMMEPVALSPQFMTPASDDSVHVAFELTRHLTAPRPSYYWADFLASEAIGWASLYLCATVAWPWRAAFFVVSVLAFYRAVVFIHELAHLRAREMLPFQAGWNILAGVPLLTPSFLYEVHLQHHARSLYGTVEDAEYLPWGVRAPRHIVLFLLASLIAPVVAVLRFLLLAPLSWLVRPIRHWVYQWASALTIRFGFRRHESDKEESSWWCVQEVGAFLWAWSVTAAVASGRLSIRWVLLTLTAMAAVSFLNSIRTLSAHRYRSDDHPMTFVEQVKDSVNHPEGVLAEIWAPIGLRYHALHHLLSSLPYHALPEAHRLLMKRLPEGSFYRQTNSPSLWRTLTTLWTNARKG
jgi:fatty acid desaturase